MAAFFSGYGSLEQWCEQIDSYYQMNKPEQCIDFVIEQIRNKHLQSIFPIAYLRIFMHTDCHCIIYNTPYEKRDDYFAEAFLYESGNRLYFPEKQCTANHYKQRISHIENGFVSMSGKWIRYVGIGRK